MSSSRDSTYRDEDNAASARQLIDEMHTNGKTVYKSFTLSRNCKPLHSTYYSTTTDNMIFNSDNKNNNNCNNYDDNENNNIAFVVNNNNGGSSSCTQKLLNNCKNIQNFNTTNNSSTITTTKTYRSANTASPTPPSAGFAIKKSTSCSSFLVDILFRGICPKRSKIKCIFIFYLFITFVIIFFKLYFIC